MLNIKFKDFDSEIKRILETTLLDTNLSVIYERYIECNNHLEYNYFSKSRTVSNMIKWYTETDNMILNQSDNKRKLYHFIRLFNKHNILGITIDKSGYVSGDELSLTKFKIKYVLVD